MQNQSRAAAALLSLFAILSAAPAWAQATASWVGDGSGNVFDGNWSDSANWNPHVVPNGNYNVTIAWSSANGQGFNGPELDVNTTVQNLTLINHAVLDEQFFNGINLTVNGTTSLTTTVGHDGEEGVIWCWAGDYRLGTLTNYTPATKTFESSWLGAYNAGTIRFHGADIVSIKGVITASRGGRILNQDSGADALTNLATIPGELFFDGTSFSTVGNLTVDGFLGIGNSDDATSFTVTGSLTNYDASTHTLQAGNYTIDSSGGNGTGTAVLRFPNADIRMLSGASLTLKGAGSSVQDSLSGLNGLRNLAGIQGANLTSAGTLTITPSGGTFTNNSATHTIDTGAHITVNGNYNATNGVVNIGGPTDSSNTTLTINNTSTMVVDGGGMDMGGQPGVNTLYTTQLQIMHGIEFRGAYLTGTGTTFADVGMINGSVFDPGHSPGQLTFVGSVTMDDTTTTKMQIGGYAEDNNLDQIMQSGGTFTIGGILLLSFLDDFDQTVSHADSFDLISSDAMISGSFANATSGTRIATNDGKGTFVVSYSGSNKVTAAQFEPPPRVVDVSKAGADFTIYFLGYPNSTFDLQASPDLNPDNFETIGSVGTGDGPDYGVFATVDPFSDGHTARFYRVVYPAQPSADRPPAHPAHSAKARS